MDSARPGSPSQNGTSRSGFFGRLFGIRRREAAETESWRRLLLNLALENGASASGRCLLLSSPRANPASGRATLRFARFLAAEEGKKVLVMDAGFGAGGLTEGFHRRGIPGLGDLLAGGGIDALAVPTQAAGVYFLASGGTGGGGGTAPDQAMLAAALDSARKSFDAVLVHVPAVIDGPGAALLAPHVDAALLLVVEGDTRLDDLDESQRILAARRAPRVGIVLARRS